MHKNIFNQIFIFIFYLWLYYTIVLRFLRWGSPQWIAFYLILIWQNWCYVLDLLHFFLCLKKNLFFKKITEGTMMKKGLPYDQQLPNTRWFWHTIPQDMRVSNTFVAMGWFKLTAFILLFPLEGLDEMETDLLKCEFCGKMGYANKFLRSKRFCTMSCAKRYSSLVIILHIVKTTNTAQDLESNSYVLSQMSPKHRCSLWWSWVKDLLVPSIRIWY